MKKKEIKSCSNIITELLKNSDIKLGDLFKKGEGIVYNLFKNNLQLVGVSLTFRGENEGEPQYSIELKHKNYLEDEDDENNEEELES